MVKKESESFKEYAQCWRDLAAQVAPPMVEREMITMMVDTWHVFYYENYCATCPPASQTWYLPGKESKWA